MSQFTDLSKPPASNAIVSAPILPTTQDVVTGINNTLVGVQNAVTEVKDGVSNTLNEFSSNNVMNASSEFLNSNSIIAKFGFLLLVLIVFLALLRVGSVILMYFMSATKQPYIVKGLLRGSVPVSIRQDPADNKSPVIYRSNNRDGGIEFTWSVWLLVNSLDSSVKYSHVFNKGNNSYYPSNDATVGRRNVATVNNSPGLYIGDGSDQPQVNSLTFIMDIESAGNSVLNQRKLVINNIPLNKWFHVAYRLKNYSLDCYVNGVLAQSQSFDATVPKQNYDDIHLNQNGGFNGSLSNLRYYDYAMSAFDINALVNYGPNLTPSNLESKSNNIFDYLGLGWYSAFK
jgi:hypothetical protein